MEYITFIEQCKRKNYRDLILQEHHIQPVSQGGSDDSSNLIKLSLHDHFWAHVYYSQDTGLCKTAPSFMLHTYCTKDNFTEKEWDEAGKVAFEMLSEAMKIIAKRKRKPHSEETKRKMSLSSKGHHRGIGRKDSDEVKEKRASKLRGLKRSEESKKLMSEKAKQRIYYPLSEEAKLKLKGRGLGRKMSEESRKKMSEHRQGRTWRIVDGKRKYYMKDTGKEVRSGTGRTLNK